MSKFSDFLGIEIDPDIVEIGRQYAPEFLGSLSDNALDTVTKWLEANHAPGLIIDLINNMVLLDRAENAAKTETLTDFSAQCLPRIIAETSQAIAELGGVFEGGGSHSIAREPMPWTQPLTIWKA